MTEETCGQWSGLRFVVLATLQLGVLKQPLPLCREHQEMAFSQWRQDVSRDVRVGFETRSSMDQVEDWHGSSAVMLPVDRISRMMELARRARIA